MSSADKTFDIEARSIEPVTLPERHGRTRNVFTLWFSANVEFATLVTGALGVGLFGLNFWQSSFAIVLGTVLGSLILAKLSTFGMELGIPQLVQSRASFGFIGNYLPAFLTFVAGVGWFAVNTILGVFALEWLVPIGFLPSLIVMVLVQMVISLYGYNLIHQVERVSFLLLVAVFLVVSFYGFGNAHYAIGINPKAPVFSGSVGGFILMVGVSFSYMLGWAIYASDYTRYLPTTTPSKDVFHNAFWSNVISVVWLEILGNALATIKGFFVPTDLVTGLLPHVIAVITMLAIILGTITANVLNIYSAALSLMTIAPIQSLLRKRALTTVIVSILGFILSDLGASGYWQNYENFLLLLSYWVSPWAAITLVDFFYHKGRPVHSFYEGAGNLKVGLWAFLIGFGASIPFFNQALFEGPIPKAIPSLGDVSYYVSFLVAGAIYYIALRIGKNQATKAAVPS